MPKILLFLLIVFAVGITGSSYVIDHNFQLFLKKNGSIGYNRYLLRDLISVELKPECYDNEVRLEVSLVLYNRWPGKITILYDVI